MRLRISQRGSRGHFPSACNVATVVCLVAFAFYFLHFFLFSVDFNLAKTVAHLQSLLQSTRQSEFEQLLLNPGHFGDAAPRPIFSRQGLRRKWDVPNLTFSPSQLEAFNHMVNHRLTLLFGPPGTGDNQAAKKLCCCFLLLKK